MLGEVPFLIPRFRRAHPWPRVYPDGFAQEPPQEVHHDRRPAHADLGLPVRHLPAGQPAGEGDPRRGDGAAVGCFWYRPARS